ncbi:unnamed protein product [Orchesella dallaii]|uniref:Uncharacterized protein n=1 Tax=Orchesella dallaii TaxID=48710 RepID=A0ABP1PZA2_9HEXA
MDDLRIEKNGQSIEPYVSENKIRRYHPKPEAPAKTNENVPVFKRARQGYTAESTEKVPRKKAKPTKTNFKTQNGAFLGKTIPRSPTKPINPTAYLELDQVATISAHSTEKQASQ